MNQQISFNSDLSSLYSYLKRCVIEQSGSHALNGIDPNAKDGTENDIKLINKFIDLELKSNKIDDKSKIFLEKLSSNLKNNLKVHQTRDCQIIETGSHYVNLTFSSRSDNFIYNLRFSVKFKQKFGSFPIDSSKIKISYFRDFIFDKKIHTKEDYTNYHYILSISEDIQYYRTDFKSNEVDIKDEIITLLPCDYLIFNKKIIEPKLTADSCTIS